MKEICSKCGTTENVNFDGMCKECYEKSVEEVIQNNKKDERTYKEDYNISKIFEIFKEKSLIILGVLIVLVFIIIIVFSTKNQNYKKSYNEIKTKYEEVEKEFSDSSYTLKKAQNEISELKQEGKQKEINAHIKTLETTQKQLENEKKELEEEIASLKREIIKIKGEPKTYPAGQLKAGTDIPIGKYKIYDGNSNFTVHSASGKLEVNIILGKSAYSVSEYIYTFKTGDEIKADSSFKLIEVQ